MLSVSANTYTYPAVFEDTGKGVVNVYFPGFFPQYPDMPPVTHGATVQAALAKAKEYLALFLAGKEEDNEALPVPQPAGKLRCKRNQTVVLVEVCMPEYRELIEQDMVGRHWHIGYYEHGHDIEAVGYKNEEGDWDIYLDCVGAKYDDLFSSDHPRNDYYGGVPLLFKARIYDEAAEKFKGWVENVFLPFIGAKGEQ